MSKPKKTKQSGPDKAALAALIEHENENASAAPDLSRILGPMPTPTSRSKTGLRRAPVDTTPWSNIDTTPVRNVPYDGAAGAPLDGRFVAGAITEGTRRVRAQPITEMQVGEDAAPSGFRFEED